jgi:hypothetical protein
MTDLVAETVAPADDAPRPRQRVHSGTIHGVNRKIPVKRVRIQDKLEIPRSLAYLRRAAAARRLSADH